MSEKYLDTAFVDKALKFAIDAHKNVERRGKGSPYVLHVMEAVTIVETMTNDPELLAAAALHDIVEDTDFTLEDIKREFGEKVADLVKTETDVVIENKTESESWHERKQQAIDRLRNATHEEKMVALGDKLSNMRAIYRDYTNLGSELWDRFHVTDPKEHKWHYVGLADSLKELNSTFAYKEFVELINKVFK